MLKVGEWRLALLIRHQVQLLRPPFQLCDHPKGTNDNEQASISGETKWKNCFV